MRKLLIPLIAAITLPTNVNAETIWLVLKTVQCAGGCGAALEKIEMATMDQCHENGEVFISKGFSADRPEKNSKAIWHTAYKCLKGK